MLYVVSGRLNAEGFIFASLLDLLLVPPLMAVLWYCGIVPGPLALAFALQDFGSFWTLLTWRSESQLREFVDLNAFTSGECGRVAVHEYTYRRRRDTGISPTSSGRWTKEMPRKGKSFATITQPLTRRKKEPIRELQHRLLHPSDETIPSIWTTAAGHRHRNQHNLG